MGKEEAVHYLDFEFDELLKNYMINAFDKYESELLNKHIVKTNYELNEAVGVYYNSLGERFFITHKEDVRAFLIKNLKYKYQGTGVWLQMPSKIDVEAYFQDLINQY